MAETTERIEYRVVASGRTLLRPNDIDGGEQMFREAAESYRTGAWPAARLQKRTGNGPWVDLDEHPAKGKGGGEND